MPVTETIIIFPVKKSEDIIQDDRYHPPHPEDFLTGKRALRSSNRPRRDFILSLEKNSSYLSPVFYSKKRNVTGPCVIIKREKEKGQK